MFAKPGRDAPDGTFQPFKIDRGTHNMGQAALRRGHGRCHGKMLHLRVSEDLVHLIDRPARDADAFQQINPIFAGLGAGHFADGLVQPRPVRTAALQGFPFLDFQPILAAQCFGELRPHLGGGRGDIDGLIGGGENPHRDIHRMVIAGLAWDFAIHQPARRLQIQHEHHGFQQAGMHIAALAGLFAFKQRHHHGQSQQIARGQIHKGNARAHRPTAGFAGNGHHPAHALGNLIHASAFPVRPGLTKA